jgi:hypothetical protein
MLYSDETFFKSYIQLVLSYTLKRHLSNLINSACPLILWCDICLTLHTAGAMLYTGEIFV